MDELGFIIIAVVVVVVPVMLLIWNLQKQQLGDIKCKRCSHVGPPKGLWAPFRGMKPVCQKCHSEDWVMVVDSPRTQVAGLPASGVPFSSTSNSMLVTCPVCQKKLRVPEGADPDGVCPKCGAEFAVDYDGNAVHIGEALDSLQDIPVETTMPKKLEVARPPVPPPPPPPRPVPISADVQKSPKQLARVRNVVKPRAAVAYHQWLWIVVGMILFVAVVITVAILFVDKHRSDFRSELARTEAASVTETAKFRMARDEAETKVRDANTNVIAANLVAEKAVAVTKQAEARADAAEERVRTAEAELKVSRSEVEALTSKMKKPILLSDDAAGVVSDAAKDSFELEAPSYFANTKKGVMDELKNLKQKLKNESNAYVRLVFGDECKHWVEVSDSPKYSAYGFLEFETTLTILFEQNIPLKMQKTLHKNRHRYGYNDGQWAFVDSQVTTLKETVEDAPIK